MNDLGSGIRQYFDETAARFDGIYSPEKPWYQKVLDALFRTTVNQRYALIMGELEDVTGRSVLDVGTGSGRYAVELAARGARVTGVDFSPEMLSLARQAAQRRGVGDRCQWFKGDFLELNLSGPFDLSLAIGFFDYVRDPSPLFDRMCKLTQGTMYLSFPKRWTLRTLPRKLRLTVNGCFVRFYSRREIERLLSEARRRPASVQVLSINRDFIVKVVLA